MRVWKGWSRASPILGGLYADYVFHDCSPGPIPFSGYFPGPIPFKIFSTTDMDCTVSFSPEPNNFNEIERSCEILGPIVFFL